MIKICPKCGTRLIEVKNKLICPNCGIFKDDDESSEYCEEYIG